MTALTTSTFSSTLKNSSTLVKRKHSISPSREMGKELVVLQSFEPPCISRTYRGKNYWKIARNCRLKGVWGLSYLLCHLCGQSPFNSGWITENCHVMGLIFHRLSLPICPPTFPFRTWHNVLQDSVGKRNTRPHSKNIRVIVFRTECLSCYCKNQWKATISSIWNLSNATPL